MIKIKIRIIKIRKTLKSLDIILKICLRSLLIILKYHINVIFLNNNPLI